MKSTFPLFRTRRGSIRSARCMRRTTPSSVRLRMGRGSVRSAARRHTLVRPIPTPWTASGDHTGRPDARGPAFGLPATVAYRALVRKEAPGGDDGRGGQVRPWSRPDRHYRLIRRKRRTLRCCLPGRSCRFRCSRTPGRTCRGFRRAGRRRSVRRRRHWSGRCRSSDPPWVRLRCRICSPDVEARA